MEANLETGSLLSSFAAAIQASLSVLLVISYGAVAAHFQLLDGKSGKVISKICVRMFLPALLFTKIGSQLHVESAPLYGIILLWAFICHLISFFIGALAHRFAGLPDWITVAIMFNNTTSYPLLLIQALDETGILTNLIVSDESTKAAIERAKSYFLVYATVSSCLTFAVGPRLIDSEHAPEPPSKENEEQEHEEPSENTALLAVPQWQPPADQAQGVGRRKSVWGILNDREEQAVSYDRRPSLIKKHHWITLGPRARWWLLFLFDFLNAPLLGAVAGAVVGLLPPVHKAFFSDTQDGGIFTAWLTTSLQTIASLFVPLPVVIAGVSLYTSHQQARISGASNAGATSVAATTFILVVRFVVWPVASIGVVYLLASRTDILGPDPMFWFALMLMPTGPPAMKLITMVQASDGGEEEEHRIAKLLTVSDPNA